jgi:hypothetical protein
VKAAPLALVLWCGVLFAGADAAIPRFSAAAPGALPAGWEAVTIPYRRAAEIALVRDQERTVLRVHSDDAFGSAAHRFRADPTRSPILSWRWKIDRVVQSANLEEKDREDFAARVYVSFDVPLEELPLVTRTKLRIARAFFGEVPAAALCYVWDNRHAPETSTWSPHYGHVRVVVLRSGSALAGQWVEERRDVDADFRAAFADHHRGPTPAIAAVIAGNDTDQTHESVTAWFGDFVLGKRP